MSSSCQNSTPPDLPLLESPGKDWESKYEQLMQDAFLQKKYDREVRLDDKWNYIQRLLPQLVDPSNEKGIVLDLGPGPGEFLEWCRHFGFRIQGIDAPQGRNGMGDAYLSLSRLMTERQKLPVDYCGFRDFIECGNDVISPASVTCINSQGSIEQACSHLMEGDNLHEHLDCRLMTWKSRDQVEGFFASMMQTFERWLMPGGEILIYANGAANTRLYERAIEKAGKQTEGLRLVYRRHRLHKWSKVAAKNIIRRPFFLNWPSRQISAVE